MACTRVWVMPRCTCRYSARLTHGRVSEVAAPAGVAVTVAVASVARAVRTKAADRRG